MAVPEFSWIKLHTIFERVPRDRRIQKIVQNKMYTKMCSFLDNPIAMGAVSLSVAVTISLVTRSGVMLSALIGLLVGMSMTFITTTATNRFKKMEDDVSRDSAERNFAVEATLHLLENVQTYANDEVAQNAIKNVMDYLKDPTTSYALWREVNECLRDIGREHEKQMAVSVQQAKINTVVERLNNKMNPPQERVFKL